MLKYKIRILMVFSLVALFILCVSISGQILKANAKIVKIEEPDSIDLGSSSDDDFSNISTPILGFGHPRSSTYDYDDHIVAYKRDGSGYNVFFRGAPAFSRSKKEPTTIKKGQFVAHRYDLRYKGKSVSVYVKDLAFISYEIPKKDEDEQDNNWDYQDNTWGQGVEMVEKKVFFRDISKLEIKY